MFRSLYFFPLFCFLVYQLQSQSCNVPTSQTILLGEQNKIRATILNGGDLLWDGQDAGFIVPFESIEAPNPSTIFALALWMTGQYGSTNTVAAAQTYGRSFGQFEYAVGPLDPETGNPLPNICDIFQTIWSVTQADIEAHIADFEDNGVINQPINAILRWPGAGNPNPISFNQFFLYETEQGWAPFYDRNGDGIYNPLDGDYPHPPNVAEDVHPAMMTWSAFNDNTEHPITESFPIKVEVHLTSWLFDCEAVEVPNQTLFLDYKFINRSDRDYHSFKAGFWTDFDLGCFTDDFTGSAPELDTYFAYNMDNYDGEDSLQACLQEVVTYENNPPVQSITFLNHPLEHFTYYTIPGVGDNEPVWAPQTLEDFHHFMSGRFRDGVPMTYGNDGWNNDSDEVVTHMWPGNPNNPSEWSALHAEDPVPNPSVLASTSFDGFSPGEVQHLTLALTYHRKPGFSHIQNVEEMYDNVTWLKFTHNNQYSNICNGVTSVEEKDRVNTIQVFPNPASTLLNIKLSNTGFQTLKLINMQGQMLQQIDLGGRLNYSLPTQTLKDGIYLLLFENGQEQMVKKVSILHQ